MNINSEYIDQHNISQNDDHEKQKNDDHEKQNNNDQLDLNNVDNKTLQEYLIKAVEYIKELQKQKNTLIGLIKNESMRKEEVINENNNINKKLLICNKKNKHFHGKIINIIFLVGILVILFFALYIKTKSIYNLQNVL